ncbi:MAG: hypothetical protein ACYCX1_00310 [Bellilinea sp.]
MSAARRTIVLSQGSNCHHWLDAALNGQAVLRMAQSLSKLY